ncbi:hypothetical protein NP493_715g02037 [Ridgeia piscesae]|uniref:Uncharacterized protein n=1 Tax=Ridgeia piscesae TaxID=27915 RepID=A0AAD9KQK4_RIDPI|nr:hypothetical protein NP493_715g02037 [Ridgeia piscesae]
MQSAAEWTHMGVAYPLQLHDGKYYISVQAVNNVQRGPLATTVCHSQPITVDRSPPVVQSITNVQYDDGTGVLSMDVEGG